jgi:hypothetical protein
MSTGGGVGVAAFRAAYSSALADHLGDRSEDALRIAYELGREAVSRRLSVLDLAVAHQEALGSALESVSGSTGAQEVTGAAGDFFLESLSSFEMVQRGFREAQEAARLERRQTEMARQLSTFLADASLALDASDSLEEVLQLVAEQARELMDADCCFATVAAPGQPRAAEATSCSDSSTRWTAFFQWLDLFAIYRIIRLAGGSVRIADHQLAALSPFRTEVGNRRLKSWLAATLTALDGSELGAIQLFDKQNGAFTESDEAVLIHLAQMASAAVERARLYQEHV